MTQKVSGVYCIELGRWKYYGSSKDIEARIHQHLVALQTGTHINVKMQRVYDKHPDRFSWDVVEEVDCTADPRLLKIREQHYISSIYGKRWVCLNLNPSAFSKRKKKQKK